MSLSLVAEQVNEFINIPRLYTAIGEWLACLIYIFFNNKKHKKKTTVLISTAFLFLLTGFHLWSDTWNLNFWILGMILVVLIMFLFIYFVVDAKIITIAYITVIAFITAEFAASLEWQIEFFLISEDFNNLLFTRILLFSPFVLHELRINLFMILFYLVLFSLIFAVEKRYQKNRRTYDIKSSDFGATLLIGILIFSISNMSFLNINTPITSDRPAEVFYIRTLVDLIGLITIYSQREHKYANEKNIEISLMENMLDTQYNQFLSSQQSWETINQKYHDMKNHLNVLRLEKDFSKQQKHLDDLEKALETYDQVYLTDNSSLDIILSSKHNEIVNNNISFNLVVDGKELDFIKTLDLVSIFGNALDNAIESLKKTRDKTKRLLNLIVFKRANFLVIKIENYYDSKIKYVKGSLITTKKDTFYHGYGIKSINLAVEKYGGVANIETENNWFILTILIPLPKNQND